MSSDQNSNESPQAQTELGPLPEDWRIVSFSSIVVETQLGTTCRETNSGNRIPLIKMGNVTWGELDFDDLEFVDPNSIDSYSDLLLRDNDLLFNTRNTPELVGKSAVWHNDLDKAVYDNNINRIRFKTTVSPDFICYQITNGYGRQRLRTLAVGSTSVAAIYWKDLAKLRVYLPRIEEQQKIVNILSTWDEAISLIERRVDAARQHRKGLMQRLLTGRVRFPEFVRFEGRQESKFGSLPVDWEVVPLQKLVKPISRPETIQPSEEYRLIGVKWYVAGAHIHSVLSGQNIKTASLSRIEENDIVYNKMWTTKAAFAVATSEHSGAYGTTEYPQFRAKENLLFVDFLGYIFHLPRFQYDAAALCRGTTGRARLNPKDFLKLEIPLPSLEEQRRIAAVLQTCDREIELLEQKRDALQRQKKGLMQRLLTGRVRVSLPPSNSPQRGEDQARRVEN